MIYSSIIRLAAVASFATLLNGPAIAQQFEPYSFTQQNRAQLAVAMKQIEGTSSSGSTTVFSGSAGGGGGGLGGTTIVCGGGSATATANSTCIILNNSDGQVTTDQISDGAQTATNSRPVTVNADTPSGADEVLSTLME